VPRPRVTLDDLSPREREAVFLLLGSADAREVFLDLQAQWLPEGANPVQVGSASGSGSESR
jgi:hypothetical protein